MMTILTIFNFLAVVLTQSVTSNVEDLIQTIKNGFGAGFLFATFDTWGNFIAATFDIVVTATVIYFILKLFDDSRAWQLLKGFIFILAFTIFCNAIGLNTINYLLSNSISVLIIGFVVIFQPELRTALETVGRNSLALLNSVSQDFFNQPSATTSLIESIAVACDNMAKTCTGALIVIERSTSLGELIKNSPSPVIINAYLTAATLEQIFYKNSPMHDGALLIRNGLIYAARCHVPLADTYHLRNDLGTRHRAAIGASEIGDTVAIVVSEERGKISIALNGRIYVLENADALRGILTKILQPKEDKNNKLSMGDILSSFKALGSSFSRRDEDVDIIETNEALVAKNKRHRILLKVLSVFISFILYAYVQTVTNPIETALFSQIPITYQGVELLDDFGYKMASSDNTVSLTLRARKETLDKIKANPAAIVPYVSIQENDIKDGNVSLPVRVKVNKISRSSFQISSIYPLEIAFTLSKDTDLLEDHHILPGVNRRGTGGLEQDLSTIKKVQDE